MPFPEEAAGHSVVPVGSVDWQASGPVPPVPFAEVLPGLCRLMGAGIALARLALDWMGAPTLKTY